MGDGFVSDFISDLCLMRYSLPHEKIDGCITRMHLEITLTQLRKPWPENKYQIFPHTISFHMQNKFGYQEP